MKRYYIVCIMLILSMPIMTAHVVSAASTTVAINPTDSYVNIGQTFSVNVNITNVANLTGWQFAVYFRNGVLNCTNVTEGPFLKTGGETYFGRIISNNYNSTYGRAVAYSALLRNNTKADGSGVLATVTFKAIGGGSTVLHLQNTKLTNNESPSQPIPHTAIDGMVHGALPTITILSPQNTTYYTALVPLIYHIDKPVSWTGYSLDNQMNVTVSSNSTYLMCAIGSHSIVLYANDTAGNMGKSNTVYFTTMIQPIIHDIAITHIYTSKTIIGEGYPLIINTTIEDQGDFAETFNVTIYANTTIIATQNNVHMQSGSAQNLTFTWDTTSLKKHYWISASITAVPGETDLTDNNLALPGYIIVTIPGDVNGDFIVNIKDATLLGVNWQKHVPPAPANVDINGDGKLDIKDATIIGFNWGKDP